MHAEERETHFQSHGETTFSFSIHNSSSSNYFPLSYGRQPIATCLLLHTVYSIIRNSPKAADGVAVAVITAFEEECFASTFAELSCQSSEILLCRRPEPLLVEVKATKIRCIGALFWKELGEHRQQYVQ